MKRPVAPLPLWLLLLLLLCPGALSQDVFPAAIEARAAANSWDHQVDARLVKTDPNFDAVEIKNGGILPVTFVVTILAVPSGGPLAITLNGAPVANPQTIMVDQSSGDFREMMRWDKTASGWSYSWRQGAATASLNSAFAFPWRGMFTLSQAFFGVFSHNNEQNFHAIDVPMPMGTPVYAARRGICLEVIRDQPEGTSMANLVRLLHADGSLSSYVHFRQFGVNVNRGQMVEEGQQVGEAGSTGQSTGPHLHFSVSLPNGVDSPYKTVPWQFRPNVTPQQGATYTGGALVTTGSPTRTPTTRVPTTRAPTRAPTTRAPTTRSPTPPPGAPTLAPSTAAPTLPPTTRVPTQSPGAPTPRPTVGVITGGCPGLPAPPLEVATDVVVEIRWDIAFATLTNVACSNLESSFRAFFNVDGVERQVTMFSAVEGSLIARFHVRDGLERWVAIERSLSVRDPNDPIVQALDSMPRVLDYRRVAPQMPLDGATVAIVIVSLLVVVAVGVLCFVLLKRRRGKKAPDFQARYEPLVATHIVPPQSYETTVSEEFHYEPPAAAPPAVPKPAKPIPKVPDAPKSPRSPRPLPKTPNDAPRSPRSPRPRANLPPAPKPPATQFATALFDYDARNERELSIVEGERLVVTDKVGEWTGVRRLGDGAMGYVPHNYIKE